MHEPPYDSDWAEYDVTAIEIPANDDTPVRISAEYGTITITEQPDTDKAPG